MKKYIPLIALGFMGIALAADAPPFEEVDANGDGAISQEEAAVIEGLDFATADLERDGTISAVIIGVGGFLGFGEKEVAVPWSQITVDNAAGRGERMVVANLDRESMESAPPYRTTRDLLNEELAKQAQQQQTLQQPQGQSSTPTAE